MTASPGYGFSILLVEDDLEQQEVARYALLDQGFRVTACDDARAAVRHFNGADFDAVLCDFGLPDMSGQELLRYVRLSSEAVSFVMLTGHDDVSTAVQSMREGADEYLVKPVLPRHLADSLLSSIERRRQIESSAKRAKQADLAPFVGYLRGVQALVNSLETKDPYTHGHSKKVAEISLMMGRAMGLSRRKLREVRIGALLHDIGKIGIPLSILHKQGPLSDDEWQVVKQHPVDGHRILEPLSRSYPEVQRIDRHEHERWDGRGYPDRNADEEIPLASRLEMVVVTFDAICSTLPYLNARSYAYLREVIHRGAGSHAGPE
ncbi:MAG: response regulator, partial [Planctomycetes bacterium]|nr:response regulator [Planctomycetota bacterium]